MKIGTSSRKCPICYEEFQKEEVIIKLPCGHLFHRQCCKNWVLQKANCPVCRDNLDAYFETDVDSSICNQSEDLEDME